MDEDRLTRSAGETPTDVMPHPPARVVAIEDAAGTVSAAVVVRELSGVIPGHRFPVLILREEIDHA